MHPVSYLHKLLEQSNQIDVELTGPNIMEQNLFWGKIKTLADNKMNIQKNVDYNKDLKRGKTCRSSRMAANEMAAASVCGGQLNEEQMEI